MKGKIMRRPRSALPGVAAAGLVLLLGGCQAIDPMHRAGMWQPDRAVQQNLAAQVANPADLVRGHGADGTPAGLAIGPIETLNAGKLPDLPSGAAGASGTGFSSGGAGGGSSGGSSGGAGASSGATAGVLN